MGILLFLWLAFGGSVPLKPESYRVTVVVPEATTLVEEADVRLAGVNIGKVKKRSLDKGAARTRVEIEIKAKYAPIPRDSKAILRQKTLLGEAFIELSPGNPKTGELEDGSQLNTKNVESTTELDEIFRIFDPPTRRAFRELGAGGLDGGGGRLPAELQRRAGQPGALRHRRREAAPDPRRPGDRRPAARSSTPAGCSTRWPPRRASSPGLITNGNETFEALASRDESLSQTFEVLPTFLRETRTHAAPAGPLRRQHPAAGQRPQGPGRRPRARRSATSATWRRT